MSLSLFRNVARHSARVAILSCVLGASALAAEAQVVFSPVVNVSNMGGGPQVAVGQNGNINVVWEANVTPQSNYQIFFARSTDGGSTFSAPVTLTDGSVSSVIPQIALDGSGNINLIWAESTPRGYNITFSRSSDGGVTFSPPQNLTPGGSITGTGDTYQVAAGIGGSINIVWQDKGIFFTRSIDGGASFSTPVDVTGGKGGGSPTVALDTNGNINIAWEELIVLSPCGSNGDGGSTLYPNFGLFFARSTDEGSTFSVPKDISSNVSDNVSGYRVAVDLHGQIDSVWVSNSINSSGCPLSGSKVFFSESSDGANFSSPRDISNGNGGLGPLIALDPLGNVNMAWANGVPSTQYVRSTDGGASFSIPRQIATGSPAQPLHMATDLNGEVFILDWNSSSASGGYLLRSNDGGTTFASTTLPGDSSSGLLNSPQAAAMALDAAGNVDLTWYSRRSTGQDLLFSRGTAVSLSAVSLSSASVAGGTSLTGMVTLNALAPTGGAVVSLSSSDPSVSVPASVTVPAGATSATFTVTTSAVSATTNVTISGTFNGATQTAGVTVRLTYKFSGYLPPLLNDGSALFHSGRTVPVKFQLSASDGSMVTNAVANVEVLQIQNTPTGTVNQDMSVTASGNSASGTAFRFDPTSNQYIYNLDTRRYTSGTYLLRTTISDGSTHDVQFSIQ